MPKNSILKEDAAIGPFVVRGGSKILVRKEFASASSWKWHKIRKPIYLYEEDIVSTPASSVKSPVWTFVKDGWVLSVRPEQFFLPPPPELDKS